MPAQMVINGKQIVILFDPAHFIKCFKAMLTDSYLQWPMTVTIDGKEQQQLIRLDWSSFEELHSLLHERGLSHLARKLTEEHLRPKYKRKMKVKLSAGLLSETNAVLFDRFASTIRGASNAALVIRDIDKLFDLTNGHTSKEAKSGIIKPARQCVSSTSMHQTEFPHFLRKLDGAKFYKLDVNDVPKVRRTPTLMNWKKNLSGILAIHKRAVLEGITEEFNPRVGLNSDGIETQFSLLKSRVEKLTAYTLKNRLRTMFIRNVVVPRNTRGNVELDGFDVEATLDHFLSRFQPSEILPNECSDETSSLPQHWTLMDVIENMHLEDEDIHAVEFDADLDADLDADVDDPAEVLFSPQNVSTMPFNWGLRDLIDDLGIAEDEDANERTTANLIQSMSDFRVIDLARTLRKKLLKKVKCQECIADITGSEGSSVYNDVIASVPHDLILNVPSERLVQLVRDSVRHFDVDLKQFTHCLDIFERVKSKVVHLLDLALLDAWPACEHRSQLSEFVAQHSSSILVRDFVKKTNESLKAKK